MCNNRAYIELMAMSHAYQKRRKEEYLLSFTPVDNSNLRLQQASPSSYSCQTVDTKISEEPSNRNKLVIEAARVKGKEECRSLSVIRHPHLLKHNYNTLVKKEKKMVQVLDQLFFPNIIKRSCLYPDISHASRLPAHYCPPNTDLSQLLRDSHSARSPYIL